MKKKSDFDTKVFLATAGRGKKILTLPKKKTVFSQGDKADAVYYIQKGRIKLTVVSGTGKEATVAILRDGDFFGENAITGHARRTGSAVTVVETQVMRIEKKIMAQILHQEHEFSEMFLNYVLLRNVRYEADLVDQLFNLSEKRLARILLQLAQVGRNGNLNDIIPKISQETLAEMVGTTRSRVSFFMNRFRKLGFIGYNGGIQVHSSLLNMVIHE